MEPLSLGADGGCGLENTAVFIPWGCQGWIHPRGEEEEEILASLWWLPHPGQCKAQSLLPAQLCTWGLIATEIMLNSVKLDKCSLETQRRNPQN